MGVEAAGDRGTDRADPEYQHLVRREIDAAGDPAAPEPPRYRRYADAAEGDC